MVQVLMYSTRICPYCRMAERLLAKRGIEPEKVLVDDNPGRREEMIRLTGRTSVPQIFIGPHHVGGYNEL
ncbi:MAG: glutaredoxin domain-containing protein, partial [Pseudomonadota bacterium]